MKIFGFEIKKQETKRKTQGRSFGAASMNNIYANWVPGQSTANVDIKRDLNSIRNRSRDLMMNDDYAKKFKRMLKTNVIGAKGLRLQNKAKDLSGQLDKQANDKIETAFSRWCKKGNCDVTGKYSFVDIQKMTLGSMAEDGEVLIRKVKGFPNEFGFALQLIEADHLDVRFNDSERNIVMGIEYDKWNKPIAYHLFKKHPASLGFGPYDTSRERIPADEINHLFLPFRISATRGVPWMHTAMTRMKMVNGYEEAELVASRVAAGKGGFYEPTANESGEYIGDYEDGDGNLVNELSPGEFEILPRGYKFVNYDPQHPTTAFKDFMKTILRGIAGGLDVSYNSLASDLESVNFSSLRSGKLEERDVWQELQVWMAENLCDDIFSDWLDMSLLTGIVSLPISKTDKFKAAFWLGRGFPWVDPYKDMLANILAKKEGLKSDTQIANEMGMDLEELYQEIQQEKKMREKYGITALSDAEVSQILIATIQQEGRINNEA